jgi:hypothetical protein
VVPYLQERLPADAPAIEPTLILMWLLEEVQAQRAEIAKLKEFAAKRSSNVSPIVRV